MTPIDTFIKHHISRIEVALNTYFSTPFQDPRDTLNDAMRYSTLAKAKRIRPLLSLAVFSLFSQQFEKIMPFACACEMVHTYSLIHDDLPAMDNDDYRRGQLTCHKKFGQDVAILSGDTLNTYAFEIVARDLTPHYPAERILHVITQMATAFGIQGMSGGQVLDLKANQATNDENYLRKTHQLKTGAMLEACIRLPAYLENCDTKTYEALCQFGHHFGVLFQIVDDILDVEGTSDELGKTAKKDMSQNKLTYVSLWGLELAKKKAEDEVRLAQQSLSVIPSEKTGLLMAFIDLIYRRKS